jgi:hypothetical protein
MYRVQKLFLVSGVTLKHQFHSTHVAYSMQSMFIYWARCIEWHLKDDEKFGNMTFTNRSEYCQHLAEIKANGSEAEQVCTSLESFSN